MVNKRKTDKRQNNGQQEKDRQTMAFIDEIEKNRHQRDQTSLASSLKAASESFPEIISLQESTKR